MRKIHAGWGIFAAVFVLTGLALCALGLRHGTLLVKTLQSPGWAVSTFFRELSAGDTEAAYTHLSNYKSLGLENTSRTEDGALLLEALCDSYRCTLRGESEQKGDTATQPIRLRFLNLDALEERVLSGEDDLRTVLGDAEELCAEADLTVTLRYDGESWKLVLDQDLLDAIQGHIPGKGSL